MSSLYDRYLLFRLKSKQDPDAFARLYDRYVEAIYRFSILKLPSALDAQDVTAETFTRAWQYIHDHREIVNIRALLYRIARNLIADKYRGNELKTLPLEAVTDDGSQTSSYMKDETEPRLMEARADLALVVKKLELLKEDYRDVLTLRLIDGLPFTVIAQILEKKTGHVRVIFHRAIKALKESEDKIT